MPGIIYVLVAVLLAGGFAFLAFICMKDYGRNMGANIGKSNNKRWGMDEGQERDWY